MYQNNNLIELKKIFWESNEIKKIFHSLRSDISVLKSALNIVKVLNVFDTQIAESILVN